MNLIKNINCFSKIYINN